MAFLRFVVLQTILVSAIAALWMAGSLDHVLVDDSRWFVAGVTAVAVIGVGLAGMGRLDDAAKLQDLLPVVAVAAMQLGILSALGVMAQSLMSAGDPSKAVGGFFAALSIALHVSVVALASYLWIRITLWLAHGE